MAAVENKSVDEVICSLAGRALAPEEPRDKRRNGSPAHDGKGAPLVAVEVAVQRTDEGMGDIKTPTELPTTVGR